MKIYDTEVFHNYFLYCEYDLKSKEYKMYRYNDKLKFNYLIRKYFIDNVILVGFNTDRYDSEIVLDMLRWKSTENIKAKSDDIIEGKFTEFTPLPNSIDLIHYLPQRQGLKTLGNNMFYNELQDLPYKHDIILTDEQISEVEKYCIKDIELTKMVYDNVKHLIDIRQILQDRYKHLHNLQLYKIDNLINCSAPQVVAKLLIGHDITRSKVDKVLTLEWYSDLIRNIASNSLKCFYNQFITYINKPAKEGKDEKPAKDGNKYIMNGVQLQYGEGGLHSIHKHDVTHYTSDNNYTILDIDVTSFYPSIMINNGMISQQFQSFYKSIYEERVSVKKTNKKLADALKLILNSTFGLLGDKTSPIYNYYDMLNVTTTGQIVLSLFIQSLLNADITFELLQVNTDGITIKLKTNNVEKVKKVTAEFEVVSKFNFEFNEYKHFIIKDVNNYIAVDKFDNIKTKGVFKQYDLINDKYEVTPNIYIQPRMPVIIKAYVDKLLYNIDIKDTIHKCYNTDNRAFLRCFMTKSGIAGYDNLVKNGRYVWVKNGKDIKNNKEVKIPDATSAQLIWDLKELNTADIDLDKYIEKVTIK